MQLLTLLMLWFSSHFLMAATLCQTEWPEHGTDCAARLKTCTFLRVQYKQHDKTRKGLVNDFRLGSQQSVSEKAYQAQTMQKLW